MPDPSSRQCRILNPLSEAREWTCVLMDACQIHFHWATTGTPVFSKNSFSILSFIYYWFSEVGFTSIDLKTYLNLNTTVARTPKYLDSVASRCKLLNKRWGIKTEAWHMMCDSVEESSLSYRAWKGLFFFSFDFCCCCLRSNIILKRIILRGGGDTDTIRFMLNNLKLTPA